MNDWTTVLFLFLSPLPALFGHGNSPLYNARSIAEGWTETLHNEAFGLVEDGKRFTAQDVLKFLFENGTVSTKNKWVEPLGGVESADESSTVASELETIVKFDEDLGKKSRSYREVATINSMRPGLPPSPPL